MNIGFLRKICQRFSSEEVKKREILNGFTTVIFKNLKIYVRA